MTKELKAGRGKKTEEGIVGRREEMQRSLSSSTLLPPRPPLCPLQYYPFFLLYSLRGAAVTKDHELGGIK